MRISDWSSDVCSSDLRIRCWSSQGRAHGALLQNPPVGARLARDTGRTPDLPETPLPRRASGPAAECAREIRGVGEAEQVGDLGAAAVMAQISEREFTTGVVEHGLVMRVLNGEAAQQQIGRVSCRDRGGLSG